MFHKSQQRITCGKLAFNGLMRSYATQSFVLMILRCLTEYKSYPSQ